MPRNSTLSSSSSFFSHLSLKLNILKGRRRTVIFLSPLSLSLSFSRAVTKLPTSCSIFFLFSYSPSTDVPTSGRSEIRVIKDLSVRDGESSSVFGKCAGVYLNNVSVCSLIGIFDGREKFVSHGFLPLYIYKYIF